MSLLTEWRDAVRESAALDTTTVAVLMVLSTYMDADGLAFPSRATLARGAKLRQAKSVDRPLRLAVEAGFLAVERSKGRAPSRYFATVLPSGPFDEATVLRSGQLSEANGPLSQAQRSVLVPPTVRPSGHESIEGDESITAKPSPEEVEQVLAGLRAVGLVAREPA